jgi:hypothetical protein
MLGLFAMSMKISSFFSLTEADFYAPNNLVIEVFCLIISISELSINAPDGSILGSSCIFYKDKN